VAVVDHRTVTEAADALFVAQPSVSQGIARLEAELGVALFERVGRRLLLTSAGSAFVGAARRVLGDVRVLRDSVHAEASLEAGTLDLSALPTLAADPLAGLVGEFRRAYPGVVVRVHEAEQADAVAEQVRDGTAELGLAELPVGVEELDAELLTVQELLVIRPPGSPSAPLTVDAFADLPLVTTASGTSTRRSLERAFTEAGRRLRISVEAGQREALVPLVLAGAGACLVPDGMAAVAARQGAVVVRLDPPRFRNIGLVARRGPRSPAAREFRELARRVATTGGPDVS
jgi:DNA-binding transcriptional LysR family regulator